MKLSQRIRDERAFVERSFGDSVICKRCDATLGTFADACTAGLQDPCPGYLAIELAKTDFAKKPHVPKTDTADPANAFASRARDERDAAGEGSTLEGRFAK